MYYLFLVNPTIRVKESQINDQNESSETSNSKVIHVNFAIFLDYQCVNKINYIIL